MPPLRLTGRYYAPTARDNAATRLQSPVRVHASEHVKVMADRRDLGPRVLAYRITRVRLIRAPPSRLTPSSTSRLLRGHYALSPSSSPVDFARVSVGGNDLLKPPSCSLRLGSKNPRSLARTSPLTVLAVNLENSNADSTCIRGSRKPRYLVSARQPQEEDPNVDSLLPDLEPQPPQGIETTDLALGISATSSQSDHVIFNVQKELSLAVQISAEPPKPPEPPDSSDSSDPSEPAQPAEPLKSGPASIPKESSDLKQHTSSSIPPPHTRPKRNLSVAAKEVKKRKRKRLSKAAKPQAPSVSSGVDKISSIGEDAKVPPVLQDAPTISSPQPQFTPSAPKTTKDEPQRSENPSGILRVSSAKIDVTIQKSPVRPEDAAKDPQSLHAEKGQNLRANKSNEEASFQAHAAVVSSAIQVHYIETEVVKMAKSSISSFHKTCRISTSPTGAPPKDSRAVGKPVPKQHASKPSSPSHVNQSSEESSEAVAESVMPAGPVTSPTSESDAGTQRGPEWTGSRSVNHGEKKAPLVRSIAPGAKAADKARGNSARETPTDTSRSTRACASHQERSSGETHTLFRAHKTARTGINATVDDHAPKMSRGQRNLLRGSHVMKGQPANQTANASQAFENGEKTIKTRGKKGKEKDNDMEKSPLMTTTTTTTTTTETTTRTAAEAQDATPSNGTTADAKIIPESAEDQDPPSNANQGSEVPESPSKFTAGVRLMRGIYEDLQLMDERQVERCHKAWLRTILRKMKLQRNSDVVVSIFHGFAQHATTLKLARDCGTHITEAQAHFKILWQRFCKEHYESMLDLPDFPRRELEAFGGELASWPPLLPTPGSSLQQPDRGLQPEEDNLTSTNNRQLHRHVRLIGRAIVMSLDRPHQEDASPEAVCRLIHSLSSYIRYLDRLRKSGHDVRTLQDRLLKLWMQFRSKYHQQMAAGPSMFGNLHDEVNKALESRPESLGSGHKAQKGETTPLPHNKAPYKKPEDRAARQALVPERRIPLSRKKPDDSKQKQMTPAKSLSPKKPDGSTQKQMGPAKTSLNARDGTADALAELDQAESPVMQEYSTFWRVPFEHVDKPDPGPVKKPNSGPVKKPDPGPVNKPDPGPVKKPNSGPVKKPNSGPVKKPNSGPVNKPNLEPVNKPDSGPVKKSDPEPVKKPNSGPVKKPNSGPVKKPNSGPVKKPNLGPVNKPDPELVKKPDPEPVKKPDPEPVKKPDPEPVKKPDPEPVKKPKPNPAQLLKQELIRSQKLQRKLENSQRLHGTHPELLAAASWSVRTARACRWSLRALTRMMELFGWFCAGWILATVSRPWTTPAMGWF